MQIESQSLFDGQADWRDQPLIAFAAFIRSVEFVTLGSRKSRYLTAPLQAPRPIKASSANVYLRMFGAFIRWLDVRNKTLFDFTSDDLDDFLEQGTVIAGAVTKQLNSAIRVRYLRLIERVLVHLGVSPNPARELNVKQMRPTRRSRAAQDAPKAFLTENEQAAFLHALPLLPAANAAPTVIWKRQRDRAMQLLMLGAGLKVSEVRALRITQIGVADSNGSVPITLDSGAANSVTRPHRTQLRPFAATEVLAWQAKRLADTDTSQLLFPAKPGSNALLDGATVYRQVKATFERAGIDPQRWGGRTLRNTFAVRELASTGSTELVGEFLGHHLLRSTQYYEEAAARRPGDAWTAKSNARKKHQSK